MIFTGFNLFTVPNNPVDRKNQNNNCKIDCIYFYVEVQQIAMKFNKQNVLMLSNCFDLFGISAKVIKK